MDRFFPNINPEGNSSLASRTYNYLRSFFNSPSLDRLQKLCNDRSDELAHRLNLSDEKRKTFNIQGETSEIELKQHIDHLDRILEVDNKLGDLLKSEYKDLGKVEKSVIDFLKQKVNNKREIFEIFDNWHTAIEEYCTNG